MSVLRLLSSVKQSDNGCSSSWTAASSLYAHDEVTTSSSTKSDDGLSLTLHVPAYGAVLMNPPDETDLQPTPGQDKPPRNDQVLQGDLEVNLPAGGGRRRCKSIQVGFKTVTKLDLGPGRMSEVDTIFERKVDFPTSGEGIWLDEGSQGFEFTLILPATLAPHDWHGNGVVIHHLYAKVEGLPNPAKTVANQSIFSSFGRSKSPAVPRRGSRPTSSSRSRSRLRSRPASPGVDETTSSLAAGTASIVIDDKVKTLPQVPPYQGPDDQNGDWLLGSYEVKRSIMLIYNPNPTGGVNELDERTSGQVAGLGVYDLKLSSDVFTICALMRAKLAIAAIPPNVTIFCFRVQLAQTTTIVSPRDTADEAKPVSHTRHFVVVQEGQRPPRGHVHPAGNFPALWKGKDAGGNDDDEFKVDAKGRLPDDDNGRPSTLPYIITPIRVSHALVTEVFFAVYGETDTGKKMPIPGPGGLRVLKISRPAVVPSCACIPQVLNLPTYEDLPFSSSLDHSSDPALASGQEICPVCGTRKTVRLCDSCPKTITPHPRHNFDSKQVGDPSFGCPLCMKNILPSGRPGWGNCACGMSLEQMEERMRGNAAPESEWDGLEEEEVAERGRTRKEQEERGRGR